MTCSFISYYLILRALKSCSFKAQRIYWHANSYLGRRKRSGYCCKTVQAPLHTCSYSNIVVSNSIINISLLGCIGISYLQRLWILSRYGKIMTGLNSACWPVNKYHSILWPFYSLFDQWEWVMVWATVWKILFYGADKLTWVTVISSRWVNHSAAVWYTVDGVSLR